MKQDCCNLRGYNKSITRLCCNVNSYIWDFKKFSRHPGKKTAMYPVLTGHMAVFFYLLMLMLLPKYIFVYLESHRQG